MRKMILTAAFAGAVMFLAAGCCCTKTECETKPCDKAAVCCNCGENCKCVKCKCAKGEKCECSKECKEKGACPTK